jgi:uncharacterized protein (DUF1800 family)
MAGLTRPSGELDVRSALEPWTGAWNVRTAAHLMRRAGFGASPARLERIAASTMNASVDALLRVPSAGAPPPGDLVSIDELFAGGPPRDLGDAARRELFKTFNMHERRSLVSLQLWWLNRMLATPAPLQEKMTLLLHGHFSTAAIQKQVTPALAFEQNQLYRTHALGSMRELTHEVSRNPAMLLYLDNAENVKSHPNENYARELMELFTLGRGNYSEEDVRQSARAFTGWTIDRRTQRFFPNPRTHDDGVKVFLAQRGNFDGAGIVEIIYRQPACARFWATALLNWFVYNDPEPELADAVAQLLRANDFRLAPVLSVLLRSNVFYSARAYRALVKSPVEFVVGTYNAFGIGEIGAPALGALAQMGQVLFEPPNVAGWPGGAAWLTSQTLLARENFLARLVDAPAIDASSWLAQAPRDAGRAAQLLLAAVLQSDAPPESYEQLAAYLGGAEPLAPENAGVRLRGGAYLAMSMPAYHLN